MNRLSGISSTQSGDIRERAILFLLSKAGLVPDVKVVRLYDQQPAMLDLLRSVPLLKYFGDLQVVLVLRQDIQRVFYILFRVDLVGNVLIQQNNPSAVYAAEVFITSMR